MKNFVVFVTLFFLMVSATAQEKLIGYSNSMPVIMGTDGDVPQAKTKTVTEEKEKIPPVVEIVSDYQNVQTSADYTLKIRATDQSGIYQVLVNGTLANSVGNDIWQIVVTLPNLENVFTIKVDDKKLNVAEKKIVIKRKTRFDRKNKDIALLFAVDNYQNMQPLYKPIADAKKLKRILENDFGFAVELVENPDLKTIRAKIADFEKKYLNNTYDKNGQLLVFFSGHGLIGDRTGFFVPKEGDSNRKYETCYSYNEMRETLKNIPVTHKLLTVDACYSAYLKPDFDRAGSPVFNNPKQKTTVEMELENFNKNQTFEYLTSDSNGKTTPDNSQLMQKLFEGIQHAQYQNGYIRLDNLKFLYLRHAQPQPYHDWLEGSDETSFMFFKK